MEELKEVDYSSALKRDYSRDILEYLANAGRPVPFAELVIMFDKKYGKGVVEKDEKLNSTESEGKRYTKGEKMKSTLHHELIELENENIINRIVSVGRRKIKGIKREVELRGIIELKYRTPLCYIFNSPGIPYVYLGLLGKKDSKTESVTETGIKLLKNFFEKSLRKKDFNFQIATVVTTHKAALDWKDYAPSYVTCWQLLKDEDINKIKPIEEKVKAILPVLVRNYILIMDCTSLTKPPSIAFYELAKKYSIPLIYVYKKVKENKSELTWVIKKEEIIKEKKTSSEIDYKKAFENDKKRAVLEELAKAGGEIQKSGLENKIGISNQSLDKTLERLTITDRIITMDNDTIKLRYKTPLCYIFDSPKTPYAYLGLLGLKMSQDASGVIKEKSETETETAIKLLTKEGFKFESVLVVNTEEGRDEWKKTIPSYVEWHIVGNEDASSVEKMEPKIITILRPLLRDYILIMDCTSLTVPATLTFYKLADEYKIPLIYIYETTKELTWLKSKKHLQEEIGIPTRETKEKEKKYESRHKSVK